VLAATWRDAAAHRLPKALRDNAAVRAFAGAAARALPPGRVTETHLHAALVRFGCCAAAVFFGRLTRIARCAARA
jgi:hypothetical protein